VRLLCSTRQVVVASRNRRATLNEYAIGDIKQFQCLEVLGVHKTPNIEVTPNRAGQAECTSQYPKTDDAWWG